MAEEGNPTQTSTTPAEGAPLREINREFEERTTMDRAQKMGMSYIDIEKVFINPDHLKLISEEDAHQSQIIPFYKVGKKVRLALSHPTNPGTQGIIRKLKEDGYAINVNLASETGLERFWQASMIQ